MMLKQLFRIVFISFHEDVDDDLSIDQVLLFLFRSCPSTQAFHLNFPQKRRFVK